MGLELYAKIEPWLGFSEERHTLYRHYLRHLHRIAPKSLLDIGCGDGLFLQTVQKSLQPQTLLGIDLSKTMVEKTRQRGLSAEAIDLCALLGHYEAATAVFDVLNYLDEEAIAPFLACVADRLEEGGSFLADINTYYGFEEVAQGALVRRMEEGCIAIESIFSSNRLVTTLDYFSKDQDRDCYRRQKDRIVQYYHPLERLRNATDTLRLVACEPITLFGQKPDKELLHFQKIG